MTKDEMTGLFALVGALWPGAKLGNPSREVRAAWHMALEPYPWTELREAAICLARTNKFPPDIADFAAACPGITATLQTERESRRHEETARLDLERIRQLLGKEAAG